MKTLEDILVLHVTNGSDIFISVSGLLSKSEFEELCKLRQSLTTDNVEQDVELEDVYHG